ncbi:MAG: hypothetical protein AB2693_24905 [Candidatus Thiodiazotropha sp.]
MRKKKETDDSVSICPCGSKVKGKPAWIACDSCSQWWHGSCVNLTKEICGIFRTKNLPFLCPKCIVAKISDKKDKDKNSEDCCEVTSPSSRETSSSQFSVKQSGKAECDIECEFPKISQDSCIVSKKVIIVDGLKDPREFQNSRDIKQEIRKYKGDVKIKYAYPLKRGGIAIHTESEDDIKLLKEDWPEEAFQGGSAISFHENSIVPRCVFKNVLPHLHIETIISEVERQTGIVVNARRLKYRDTGKPMPIVIITCNSFEDQQTLFKSKVILCKKNIKVTSYQSKRGTPTRCYNCQEFGHIAVLCKKETKCEYCAEGHRGACSSDRKCVNCGNNHPSSSISCPVYIAIKERLSSRF